MEGRASPKRSKEGDAASHVGVAGRRLPMCGLQAGQSVALSRQETAQAKGLSLNQDRSLHVITYTAVGGLRMPHCENPRLCVRALHHLPSEQPWCTVSPGTQTTTSEHVADPSSKHQPTEGGRPPLYLARPLCPKATSCSLQKHKSELALPAAYQQAYHNLDLWLVHQ